MAMSSSKAAVSQMSATFRREFLMSRSDQELERLWLGMLQQMYEQEAWWADTLTRQLLYTCPSILQTGIEGVPRLQLFEMFATLGFYLAEDELRQVEWATAEAGKAAGAPLVELMLFATVTRKFEDSVNSAVTKTLPLLEFYLKQFAHSGRQSIPSAGGRAKNKEANAKQREVLRALWSGLAQEKWKTATEAADELQSLYLPDKGPGGSSDPYRIVYEWISPVMSAYRRSKQK